MRPESDVAWSSPANSWLRAPAKLPKCLAPVLVVSGGASSAPAAAITEISRKDLRSNLEVSGSMQGDIR